MTPTIPKLERHLNDVIVWPSQVESSINCLRDNAKPSRPLSGNQSLSFVRDRSIPSCIGGLINSCCPSAVFWCVVARIVYSLNRMVGSWSRPHVCNEERKIEPAITYIDASSSVLRKGLGSWAATAINNCSPYAILWTLRHTVCLFHVLHYTTDYK